MLKDYFSVELRQSQQIAVPLEQTAEAIAITRQQICPIPGVAPALLGVTNQRGKLLWVLELSNLLQLPPSLRRSRPQDSLTVLVLKSNSNQSLVGCVVSCLKGIIPLDSSQFIPLSNSTPVAIRSFVSNITEIEHSSLAILNIDAIFATLQTSPMVNL